MVCCYASALSRLFVLTNAIRDVLLYAYHVGCRLARDAYAPHAHHMQHGIGNAPPLVTMSVGERSRCPAEKGSCLRGKKVIKPPAMTDTWPAVKLDTFWPCLVLPPLLLARFRVVDLLRRNMMVDPSCFRRRARVLLFSVLWIGFRMSFSFRWLLPRAAARSLSWQGLRQVPTTGCRHVATPCTSRNVAHWLHLTSSFKFGTRNDTSS